ncbi:hypothetical protein SAMN04488577_1434 [Bacillus sp. cl95]|nr:hypothetical protein SAMN02799634_107209 [Bacillus sp. UNCCL13]SFQ76472.1 hypothetical protein SAMN04488577_1434 [Bacillus sp. cl95]
MGQLIKLQDFISRYEQNIFSYPGRFVRLKVQQWERTKENWETEGIDASNLSISPTSSPIEEEKQKQPLLGKIMGMLGRNQNEEVELPPVVVETGAEGDPDESSLQFSANILTKPSNLDELKLQFLEQLFKFQMKWASSTLSEKSFLDSSYYHDENLKFFLQRFPDTFLFLYRPVFLLKKAPIEAEIIMLTPTEAWCITFIEREDSAVFVGSNDRFWLKRNKNQEQKVLNPLMALNRTEKIVKKIFQLDGIELPIHKLVLSRNGYIDFPNAPLGTEFVEKRNFETWFQRMRLLKSPLKHMQLKGAQSLLRYCQTTSVRRLEWEVSEENK